MDKMLPRFLFFAGAALLAYPSMALLREEYL